MVLSRRRQILSMVLLTGWSVLLTALTGLFGSVPLRGLRQLAGGTLYWILGLGSAVGLALFGWWILGLLMVAMVTVIGLYTEFEERGHSLSVSGFGSVVITTLMLAGVFAFWVSQQAPTWISDLTSRVDMYLSSLPGWSENFKIEGKDLLMQLPSAVVVILILGLFLALLLQRRVLLMVGLRSRSYHRLTRFKVPESFIWVLLFGLVGAFVVGSKSILLSAIGLNLLNVAALVFYLQGLAVIAIYFETFRVGWFWQMLTFVLLVTQLFIVVSIIGLFDYWMDFRARLSKRTDELEREIFKK